MKNDDDFNLLRGFADRQTDKWTNERTDIGDCRVAFVTENIIYEISMSPIKPWKDENSPRALGSNHLAQPEHDHPLVLPQSLDTEEVTDGEG